MQSLYARDAREGCAKKFSFILSEISVKPAKEGMKTRCRLKALSGHFFGFKAGTREADSRQAGLAWLARWPWPCLDCIRHIFSFSICTVEGAGAADWCLVQ